MPDRMIVSKARSPNTQTKLAARCAACLWLALAGMYATVFWPFAVPWLMPFAALLVRPASRRVLQASSILGLLAAGLGVAAYQGTTANWRFEVIGVIVLPIAITLYSCFALWRLPTVRRAVRD
jgi:hypothetical protein